jgi:hypothetical protein
MDSCKVLSGSAIQLAMRIAIPLSLYPWPLIGHLLGRFSHPAAHLLAEGLSTFLSCLGNFFEINIHVRWRQCNDLSGDSPRGDQRKLPDLPIQFGRAKLTRS